MKDRFIVAAFGAAMLLGVVVLPKMAGAQAAAAHDSAADFKTSDPCLTCHQTVKTVKGDDLPLGLEWTGSAMANSARDPYWQGSVRREVTDHAQIGAAIENECASCHMPLDFQRNKENGKLTEVLKRLPFRAGDDAAADGVSCTVCHQILATGLGTASSYSGNYAVAGTDVHPRPLYGPYAPDPDGGANLHEAAAEYTILEGAQMRDAAMCGSCHTLFTTSYGPDGKEIGKLPEQMPYIEWLHSDYKDKQSCQQCHMPAVDGQAEIAIVASQPRDGVRRHTFSGANFLLIDMLSAHSTELGVAAIPATLEAETARTRTMLETQSARLTVSSPKAAKGVLKFTVRVENLTGHKLPTAFPSRRAWLHVTATAADGKVVFESGKLNADGSIAGNANDEDAARYSPHYARITKADEVEIFEPILGDSTGHVTTGLLSATQYLKDNRILPTGFDKKTAPPEIAVHGEALEDASFKAGESTTEYAVSSGAAAGPFKVTAELEYQPVGYRWAQNLAVYKSAEPQRFVNYYGQAAGHTAAVLAKGQASTAGQ